VLRSALLVLFVFPTAPLSHIAAQSQEQQTTSHPSAAAGQSISQQVLDAEASIVKSDWKIAQLTLDSWIAGHPDDSRALFDAGYVADAQNRLDDAATLYRRAVSADPRSFEAHLSLGLLLARQGKPDEARPELVAATLLDPGDADPAMKARAWRALAQIDRPGPGNPGDTTRASDDLLEALKLSPETADDTLLAADLAGQAGELDAAESAYRRVLTKDPKSAAANAGLAHILITRKQYPEAETLLRAALEQSPDDPSLTAQLATVLAAQDKAEALPLIQKLHEARPTDANVTRMLAEVLAEAGDAAGSDALYTKLLAAAPRDPALLVAHGQNLTRQLKYSEAYAAFDKATQIDAADADGWSGLAFAASRTNQPAIVLHALTMRSKYLPDGPSTYFLWAISYDALHDRKSAIAYYHQFLDSSGGKFPNEEWQAQQRIKLLENKP
jgi:predicted Zn-dependent protease